MDSMYKEGRRSMDVIAAPSSEVAVRFPTVQQERGGLDEKLFIW